MMKKNRLNYKHILAFFVMIIVVITLFWQLFRVIFASPIVFVSQTQEVEIDSEVDYCAFIKEVKNGKIEDEAKFDSLIMKLIREAKKNERAE